jgi:hypothetical protein
MRATLVAAAIIATLGGAGALAITASGQSEDDGILRYDAKLAKGGFTIQDHGRKGESAGDTLQFRDALSTGGQKAGRDAGSCVRVSPREQMCQFALILPGGRLQATGVTRDGNGRYTIPIVGGTGDYTGATGTLSVTDAAKAVAHYEVDIAN